MPPRDVVDPFHRQLYNRISDDLQQRSDAIAGGSASVSAEDKKTVAEKYAAQVSYILALRNVLELCEDISGEMMGARPGPGDD